MPIDGSKLPEGYPIYTFVDAETGQNTHIDTEKLRAWCYAMRHSLVIHHVPVDEAKVREFVEQNAVDMARVMELLLRDKPLDPIIFAHDGTYSPENGGPNMLLVDGRHRYTLAHKCGLETIPAYLVDKHDWKHFEIVNIPDLTREQLAAVPIRERNY